MKKELQNPPSSDDQKVQDTELNGTQKTGFSLKNWLSNARLTTRNRVDSTSFNWPTFFAFFPFTLGFLQFLVFSNKVNSTAKNQLFFVKTLPAFANFTPKVTHETLEYISKFNSTFSPVFGQQKFLASLASQEFMPKMGSENSLFLKNKDFTGFSSTFYLISSKISSSPVNLDELPSYLQALPEIDSTSSLSSSILVPPNEVGEKELQTSSQKEKKGKDGENVTKFFKGETLSPTLTAKFFLVKNNHSNKSFGGPKLLSSQNSSSHEQSSINQIDFYTTLKEFETELERLFVEKNVFLNEKNLQEPSETAQALLDTFVTLDQSFLDENLVSEIVLKKFQRQELGEETSQLRLMSGYMYPDTTTFELEWFSRLQPVFGKTLSFVPEKQVRLLSGVSLSAKYPFFLKNIPQVFVKTKDIVLKTQEKNKLLYKGPGLVLDSNKALDWETRHGKNSLRFWFTRYLSPVNPIPQHKENFLGLRLSGKTADFSKFQENSLYHEIYVPAEKKWGLGRDQAPSLFTSTHSSFHFSTNPSLDEKRNVRGVDALTDELTETTEFLPVIQIKQPSFDSFSGKRLKAYSPLFDVGLAGNLDYTFSLDSFISSNWSQPQSSGQYGKIATVFSKTSVFNSTNFENWEPLTASSWLIITQLSFAFFSFNVLKSLADNYGRELLGYLLDLVAFLGILDDSLKQEIEILMGNRNKGFRVIPNSSKTFKDIVGIEKFLPEIYEVLWFLRNSARDFALRTTVPRGILLAGPPGTGKTLLVQALAGEAQVPVIVLSGSSLIEPGESGSDKLEMAFQEARQFSPCIVFIDEIDTFAEKRSGVVHNPMDKDNIVESLTNFESTKTQSPLERLEFLRKLQEAGIQEESLYHQTSQQVASLTQLLIELDGIRGRDGVLVIGATNRPEVLDPALLRPGRFDKTLTVGLPTVEKRVEILQFYSQNLGYEKNLPWNYLAERTVGFAAADLAAVMNESSIKAILTQNRHSIETIEHGIDRLMTSENEKYTLVKTKNTNSLNLSVGSKMELLRIAYYQAGKIILSYVLENHPKSVFASLWPRRSTFRSLQIAANIENSMVGFRRLSEIQDRVIGCYAGKAAEFLFLYQFATRSSRLSTLGLEDLLIAQKLVYSMLEKSFFYSKKRELQAQIKLKPNENTHEFFHMPDKKDLYQEILEEDIETPPMKKTLEENTSSLASTDEDQVDQLNRQWFYSVPWWQQETSYALEFVEKNFANWTRFYLYDPELNYRNVEWRPPDEFYHRSSALKNAKKAYSNIHPNQPENSETTEIKSQPEKPYPPYDVYFSWNDISNLTRDYPIHSLILQSFNKALVTLNQNRELLDRLVVELLYNEKLRQPEIDLLMKDLQSSKLESVSENRESSETKKRFHIVESSWGPASRKPVPRWIDFVQLSSHVNSSS